MMSTSEEASVSAASCLFSAAIWSWSRRRQSRRRDRICVCGKAGRSFPRSQKPDDAQAGPLPQVVSRTVRPANGVSRAGSSATWSSPELLRRRAPPARPTSTRFARYSPSWSFSGSTVVRAAQLQNLHRLLFFGDGDNRHVGRDLAHGERDVRVGRVLAIGEHQPGLRPAASLVGLPRRRSVRPRPDISPTQPAGPRRIRLDHEIRNLLRCAVAR